MTKEYSSSKSERMSRGMATAIGCIIAVIIIDRFILPDKYHYTYIEKGADYYIWNGLYVVCVGYEIIDWFVRFSTKIKLYSKGIKAVAARGISSTFIFFVERIKLEYKDIHSVSISPGGKTIIIKFQGKDYYVYCGKDGEECYNLLQQKIKQSKKRT